MKILFSCCRVDGENVNLSENDDDTSLVLHTQFNKQILFVRDSFVILLKTLIAWTQFFRKRMNKYAFSKTSGYVLTRAMSTNCRQKTPSFTKQCCFECCFFAEMNSQHPPLTFRPNVNIGLGRGAQTSSYSLIVP